MKKVARARVIRATGSGVVSQAEILVGGLEAQLPFSVEGINIPEGLHNRVAVPPPCHLKTRYLHLLLKPMTPWNVSIQKMSKASRTAQVLQSIHPSVNLLRAAIKLAKSFRAIKWETS